jgi:5-methylcytosine-specific restriction endonuclease McrA
MRRYPEKRRMWESARRARKLDQFVENVDPTVVYEMHGGMCGVCEEFIVGEFHVDHVVPLVRGGLHGYVNVQPAHPKCNLSKGGK